MSAKSLFNIILKVLGIYFIKDIITSIPALLGSFYGFTNSDPSGAISVLAITLFTLIIYAVVVFYLVFKTTWVMDKLKLLENVPEDPIPLNIHRSTILSISILVVGLYLITQGIPLLIRGLTEWYRYNRMTRGFFNGLEPFDYSSILMYMAEIIIGLLLIGNQRPIVNYIELKARRNDS